MGSNILTAIVNIANYNTTNLKEYSIKSKIRINMVGEQLENYIKDAISNTFDFEDEEVRMAAHGKVFSWLGNQNNPPDIIIRGGDAIEVKKYQSPRTSLALNNSYPKNKLYNNDSRITTECAKCEDSTWFEKDIFYILGFVKKSQIKQLFFVQGECYAANRDIYHNLLIQFKDKVNALIIEQNMEGVKTKEVGRITKVDPLGITTFRIRGMWEIKNPLVVFDYVDDQLKDSFLNVIMLKKKYDSFPREDINNVENSSRIKVKDIQVSDPNNPARMLNAIYLTIPGPNHKIDDYI